MRVEARPRLGLYRVSIDGTCIEPHKMQLRVTHPTNYLGWPRQILSRRHSGRVCFTPRLPPPTPWGLFHGDIRLYMY